MLGWIDLSNFLDLCYGVLPITIGQVHLPLDLRVFILELQSHLWGGKFGDNLTDFNLLLDDLIFLFVRQELSNSHHENETDKLSVGKLVLWL